MQFENTADRRVLIFSAKDITTSERGCTDWSDEWGFCDAETYNAVEQLQVGYVCLEAARTTASAQEVDGV